MRKVDLERSTRVLHCDACGLVIDRDLDPAKNLAALTELACACLCLPDGTVDDRATSRLVQPPRPPSGLEAGPPHPQSAGMCPSRMSKGRRRG